MKRKLFYVAALCLFMTTACSSDETFTLPTDPVKIKKEATNEPAKGDSKGIEETIARELPALLFDVIKNNLLP